MPTFNILIFLLALERSSFTQLMKQIKGKLFGQFRSLQTFEKFTKQTERVASSSGSSEPLARNLVHMEQRQEAAE